MKRNYRVKVGFTAEERIKVRTEANKHGLTISSYLRFVLQEYERLVFDIKDMKRNIDYIKNEFFEF